MRESFTMISILFITFLFMSLIIAYILSGPIDLFYLAILNADVTGYENTYIPYYRSATIMVFALGIASPFGWLVAKVFEREVEYDPYQRRF